MARALLLAWTALAWASPVQVRLMATADLHCPLAEAQGLARVASTVAALRQGFPASILLDAGDCLQGSLAADYYALVDTSAHPLVDLMGSLRYGAAALGDGDLSYGLDFLRRVARQARFPFLAANVQAPGAPWKPFVTLRAGPCRVLVVGVVTPWAGTVLGPWLPQVTFRDPVQTLRSCLPTLIRQERPDLVCVLAHAGWRGDSTHVGWQIAQVPAIDVLFLGHCDAPWDTTVGTTLVLQPGPAGSSVAVATLTLERRGGRWTVVAREAELKRAAGSDPWVASQTEAALAAVRRWADTPVVTLPRALDGSQGLLRMDEVSSWVGEVVRRLGEAPVALVEPREVSLPAGPLTRRDLAELVPRPDRVVTLRVARDDLVRSLERSASLWEPYSFQGLPPKLQSSAHPFVAATGISYVVDLCAPPGQRIRSLTMAGVQVPESVDVAASASVAATWPGPRGPVVRVSPVWLREALVHSPPREGQRQEGWQTSPPFAGTWMQQALDMFLSSRRHLLSSPWDEPVGVSHLSVLQEAWGGELPASFVQCLQTGPTRGDLLASLVRATPHAVALPGCGHARFADLPEEPRACVWDSVVATGLTAFFPEDRLQPHQVPSLAEATTWVLNARYRALTLACTNDFHGQLEPDTRRGLPGIEALAGWVARARKLNPHGVVLLDAGDAMQGTPLSNLFQGSSTISLYRHLGYDALTLGNHDFDWGQEVLKARAQEAGFPFLGANVWAEGTHEPPPWVEPSTVITRGGVRVAVVGLVTQETPWVTMPSHVAGLTFQEPGWVLEGVLPRLGGADLVVVVGHLGLEFSHGDLHGEALAVTPVAAPHCHAFFHGHTHQTYATRIQGLLHLQAGSRGRAVSRVTAWLDRRGGEAPKTVGWVEPLAGFRDSLVGAMVEELRAQVAPQTQVVITTLAHPVSSASGPSGESPMGRLIAEAQRWMVGVPIALMNAGGVRSDLAAGAVTWQDLFTVQPFGNTLVKVTLTGQELRMALEQGISPTGSILQVAGLLVWIDPRRSFGARVVNVLLEDGTPLDPHGRYTVVVNSFMASGGDGFTVLRDAASKYDTGIVDLEALVAYLRAQPTPVSLDLPPRVFLARG